MKHRSIARFGRGLTLLALVLTTAGWGAPTPTTFVKPGSAEPGPDLPGEVKLVNLSHVFAHDPGGARAKGTDIEFYTSTVPVRDENGEIVRDELGEPVLVEKDFAVMGSYNRGAFVYDITDPENASLVRLIACNQTQNDVQIKSFPDAEGNDRWILALARDGSDLPCTGISTSLMPSKGNSSGGGIAVFDITDPWDPKPVYRFRVPSGAHNFTFHPTKP
ncbi:MAG TPA: hypothetical protein VM638_06310, partial [Actinomycetota bacterium]|nr:hypothetical protein [Actinomycetota bacterium]